MTAVPKIFVAFAGMGVLSRGTLGDVVRQCMGRLDQDPQTRLAVFDDENGHRVDIDFSGGEAEILARLATHPMAGQPEPQPARRQGPGRPRLGVVSREVSLLPRHWGWLSDQKGGASAALRKLVDAARRESADRVAPRDAIESAHRFMWDMAGDLADFEEASRALFAQDFDGFAQRIQGWPAGIQEQLARFIDRARPAEPRG